MSALEGASKYLNNLLLARGLLQDGKPVDFAHPEHGSTTTDATMSRVINLVHDLVLRRDREAEQHDAMMSNIRKMRTEQAQQQMDFQRIQDKNVQLKNHMAGAVAEQRALQESVRRAEQQTKELKEQTMKMKSTLDQVRARSITDLQKRDVEIQKLKDHITDIQRRKKDFSNTSSKRNTSKGAQQDTGSANWSLEKESPDILTALVNETSTENVNLRKILCNTMNILKDMSGLDQISEAVEEEDGIGIPGQYRKSRQKAAEAAQSGALVSCQTLAEKMNLVLEHCRTILKDPSFVPIEEVQTREEEIAKLRAGWEKMADRWKEAVTMMSQWKQRMLQDGKQADVEGWSDLSFGRSIAVRPDGQPVLGYDEDMSSIFDQSRVDLVDDNDNNNDNDNDNGEAGAVVPVLEDSDTKQEDQDSDIELRLVPARKSLAASPAKRGVRLIRPSQPFCESDGNVRLPSSIAHGGETSLTNTSGLDNCFDVENDTFHYKTKSKSNLHTSKHLSKVDSDDTENLPKLSVAQKLAAVESEAAEARLALDTKSSRKRKAIDKVDGGRKGSRRRSTLHPEELAMLMKS